MIPLRHQDTTAPPSDALSRMDVGWSARTQLVARYAGPRTRVLDVGCSYGDYALAAASTGAIVHAVDIDPTYLTWIRSYASQRSWSVTTEQVDVTAWKPPAEYDLVWFTPTLMLLPRSEQPRVLARLASGLGAEGRIVCDFYTPAYLWFRIFVQNLPLGLRARSVGTMMFGRHSVTCSRFQSIVREAGLEIVAEEQSPAYDACRAVEGHSFDTIFGRYFRCYVLRAS